MKRIISAQNNVIEVLRAHRVGPGRWRARCPAHRSRSLTLSIRAGDDGHLLLHCFAGCSVKSVLAAAGLSMRDLYPGPPPTPAERAALRRQREAREAAIRRLRRLHADGCYRLLAMQRIADDLAPRLMVMPDGPDANKLTELFQCTLSDSRHLEAALILVARGTTR